MKSFRLDCGLSDPRFSWPLWPAPCWLRRGFKPTGKTKHTWFCPFMSWMWCPCCNPVLKPARMALFALGPSEGRKETEREAFQRPACTKSTNTSTAKDPRRHLAQGRKSQHDLALALGEAQLCCCAWEEAVSVCAGGAKGRWAVRRDHTGGFCYRKPPWAVNTKGKMAHLNKSVNASAPLVSRKMSKVSYVCVYICAGGFWCRAYLHVNETADADPSVK